MQIVTYRDYCEALDRLSDLRAGYETEAEAEEMRAILRALDEYEEDAAVIASMEARCGW